MNRKTKVVLMVTIAVLELIVICLILQIPMHKCSVTECPKDATHQIGQEWYCDEHYNGKELYETE